MNIRELIEYIMEVPIEEHETAEVAVQVYPHDGVGPLTQEEHDALPYNYELILKRTPTEDVGTS
jgi:hypothetical protein